MKLGIIRCANKEASCGAVSCLQAVKDRAGDLAGVKKVILFGVLTCGGCPGKKIAIRARRMIQDEGIDKVCIADCISNQAGDCPWNNNILDSVKSAIGEKRLIYLDKSKEEV